jgi:hypothetical protein
MADDIRQIVTRMVEAGESEENIASVIRRHKELSGSGAAESPVARREAPQATGREGDGGRAVEMHPLATIGEGVKGFFKEGARRLAGAAYGIPGVSAPTAAAITALADERLAPTNTAQRVGQTAEQVAEFFIPVAGQAGRVKAAADVATRVAPRLVSGAAKRVLPHAARAADEAATAGAVAAAQGSDPVETAAVAGSVAAGIPAVGAGVQAVAGPLARRLVRSTLKPTAQELKKIPGAATETEKKARLVEDVIDYELPSARAVEDELKASYARGDAAVGNYPSEFLKVQEVASRVGLPKAAPKPTTPLPFVEKRLNELIANLKKQSTGSAKDVEIVESVLDEYRQLPTAPGVTLNPQSVLESAKEIGRSLKGKTVGEITGAEKAARKQIELAERDYVKAHVPKYADAAADQGRLRDLKGPMARADAQWSILGGRKGVGGATPLVGALLGGGFQAYGSGNPVTGGFTALGLAVSTGLVRNPALRRRVGIRIAGLERAIAAGDDAAVTAILKQSGIKGTAALSAQERE